jgi:hypothetical protein
MFFPQKWFRMDSYFSLENEWFLKPWKMPQNWSKLGQFCTKKWVVSTWKLMQNGNSFVGSFNPWKMTQCVMKIGSFSLDQEKYNNSIRKWV